MNGRLKSRMILLGSLAASGCVGADSHSGWQGPSSEDGERALAELARAFGELFGVIGVMLIDEVWKHPARANALRCEVSTCQGDAAAEVCEARGAIWSDELMSAVAQCMQQCEFASPCFDQAVAAQELDEPRAQRVVACQEAIDGCAIESDVCRALGVLESEPVRLALEACNELACEERRACFGHILLPDLFEDAASATPE